MIRPLLALIGSGLIWHAEAQQIPACAGVADDQFVRNSASCNAYYSCKNQEASAAVCPGVYLFEPLTQTCDVPIKVDCKQCSPFGIQNLEDPMDRSKFYHCITGVRTHRTCAEGLAFDVRIGDCNLERSVPVKQAPWPQQQKTSNTAQLSLAPWQQHNSNQSPPWPQQPSNPNPPPWHQQPQQQQHNNPPPWHQQPQQQQNNNPPPWHQQSQQQNNNPAPWQQQQQLQQNSNPPPWQQHQQQQYPNIPTWQQQQQQQPQANPNPSPWLQQELQEQQQYQQYQQQQYQPQQNYNQLGQQQPITAAPQPEPSAQCDISTGYSAVEGSATRYNYCLHGEALWEMQCDHGSYFSKSDRRCQLG